MFTDTNITLHLSGDFEIEHRGTSESSDRHLWALRYDGFDVILLAASPRDLLDFATTLAANARAELDADRERGDTERDSVGALSLSPPEALAVHDR